MLDRIQQETKSDDHPEGALSDIAADLRELVDGVTGLEVAPDPQSRDFRIEVRLGDQKVPYSSHLVSDGTLRALALCALFNDPSFSGVLLMEQPEDGMHPARLLSMFERMREHTTDPSSFEGAAAAGLQQIITNSHSPVLLGDAHQRHSEAFFADSMQRAQAGGTVRRTRIRPVIPGNQGELPPSSRVSDFEVERYLKTVRGAS